MDKINLYASFIANQESNNLEESLDRSFPYKYHGEGEENTHEYSFTPGKGASKIRVSIIHNHKKKSASVTFHRQDGQETATGEHPRTAAKVFGTVAKIVKEHGKKHRDTVDNINFAAAKSEPSRVSLYRRITKRMGGKETEPNKSEINFTVPNRLTEMEDKIDSVKLYASFIAEQEHKHDLSSLARNKIPLDENI